MLRGTDVIGVAITLAGQHIDRHIQSWIFDVQTNYLLGFLVSKGGWKGSARVLLWEDVSRVSARGMHVEWRSPVLEVSRVTKVKEILESPEHMIGLDVVASDGKHFGRLTDIFFDEATGAATGFAVTSYRQRHSQAERTFMPVIEPLNIRDDIVMISAKMLAAMQETPEHGEKEDNPVDRAIGRRVRRDVRDDEEYILAAAGQIVTPSVIKAVQHAEREHAFLHAVGIKSGES